MVGIIQCNRYIRIAERFPVLRTRKNNILHGRPTQLLDRLLSKYPAHRIRNVTFSTSVRSYNARDSLVEFKYNFVCK